WTRDLVGERLAVLAAEPIRRGHGRVQMTPAPLVQSRAEKARHPQQTGGVVVAPPVEPHRLAVALDVAALVGDLRRRREAVGDEVRAGVVRESVRIAMR